MKARLDELVNKRIPVLYYSVHSKIIKLRDVYHLFEATSVAISKGGTTENIFVFKRRNGLKKIEKELKGIRGQAQSVGIIIEIAH